MDSFFNILKKSLVLTMMLVFGFVFTYVPQYFNRVATVEAIGITTVEAPGPQLTAVVATAASAAAGAAASGVTAGLTGTIVAKEFTLDGIAFIVGKAIISSIIGSLIKWINSGFKGKPAFIQDVKRFLIDAADRAAGEYINSLGGIGSFICSPFQLDIQIALAVKYQQAREHDEPDECRISGIVDNLEEFYNNTFNDSSLEDFITITSDPEQYTPYGQLLSAEANMRVRLANAKGQVLTEADWGGGFLSGKICQMIEGSKGPKESCAISKPGQVIAGTLNKALGAGQDQLVEADEINEIIAALIAQLANQAITGAAGLLGLTPGTGYTTPGFAGGSYIDAAVAQANEGPKSASDLSTQTSATTFTTAITVQNDAVTAANRAIQPLLDYANDETNPTDKRDTARAQYNDAVATRDKALADRVKIQTVLNEFNALKTEFDKPETTLVRKQEITKRQTELQTVFNGIGAITRTALNTKISAWNAAAGTTGGQAGGGNNPFKL